MTKAVSFVVAMLVLSVFLFNDFKLVFADPYLPLDPPKAISPQFEESIDLLVSVGLPPGDVILARNVRFEFDNLAPEPPVNLSLPGVWDHFRSASLYVGYNFLGFYSYYDSQPDNNITETHARAAAEEFLKAFNYTDLAVAFGHEPSFDSVTGSVNFRWGFGPLSKNMQTVDKFLKYKPNVGFGNLISTNFLNLYLSGIPNAGLVGLQYDLVKNTTSGSYSWGLDVESSVSELFSTGEKSADLNRLLGNDKPITSVIEGLSRIRVEIMNRTQLSFLEIKKYIFTDPQVSPPGYIGKADVEGEEAIYDWFLSPNSSMDNVVVTFQANELVVSLLGFPIEWLVPIVCVAILSITIVYLIYRYKHRKATRFSLPNPDDYENL